MKDSFVVHSSLPITVRLSCAQEVSLVVCLSVCLSVSVCLSHADVEAR